MDLADRKIGFAIVGSALIHLGIGSLLAWRSSEHNERSPPIRVEYLSPGPQLVNKRRKRPSGPRIKEISIASLRPASSLQPAADPHASEGEDEPTWTEARAYDGPGADVSVVVDDFMGSLWRTVNRLIDENPFLSEYNHTGQVFLRFEVNESGQLENPSLRAAAIDRVLKVIATRALRKALKNETGDIHPPHQRMTVNARFTWGSYEACASQRGHHSNVLSFCHYAENKRKSFSSEEKVSTYANAIYNNGPWAIEEIQKYNREQSRRRTQFDPFVDLENDPDWNL